VKPLDHHALADAVPLPKQRGNATRDWHLREAARLHCADESSEYAVARKVYTALLRYREGAHRRERLLESPPEWRRGRIEYHLWKALAAKDRAIALITVRRALK
jgi:hypothetical protein